MARAAFFFSSFELFLLSVYLCAFLSPCLTLSSSLSVVTAQLLLKTRSPSWQHFDSYTNHTLPLGPVALWERVCEDWTSVPRIPSQPGSLVSGEFLRPDGHHRLRVVFFKLYLRCIFTCVPLKLVDAVSMLIVLTIEILASIRNYPEILLAS